MVKIDKIEELIIIIYIEEPKRSKVSLPSPKELDTVWSLDQTPPFEGGMGGRHARRHAV